MYRQTAEYDRELLDVMDQLEENPKKLIPTIDNIMKDENPNMTLLMMISDRFPNSRQYIKDLLKDEPEEKEEEKEDDIGRFNDVDSIKITRKDRVSSRDVQTTIENIIEQPSSKSLLDSFSKNIRCFY